MPFRLLFPGVVWIGVMILIIFSPIADRELKYFESIPPRAFVHCFLYMVFVHIWLGVLKKQLKYEQLRDRAFHIVFGVTILVAVFSESALYSFGLTVEFNFWNLLFDLIGGAIGMGTFHLLYRDCY